MNQDKCGWHPTDGLSFQVTLNKRDRLLLPQLPFSCPYCPWTATYEEGKVLADEYVEEERKRRQG